MESFTIAPFILPENIRYFVRKEHYKEHYNLYFLNLFNMISISIGISSIYK